jgi:hypothetical protein
MMMIANTHIGSPHNCRLCFGTVILKLKLQFNTDKILHFELTFPSRNKHVALVWSG